MLYLHAVPGTIDTLENAAAIAVPYEVPEGVTLPTHTHTAVTCLACGIPSFL